MPKPPPPDSPFWKLWEVGTRVNIALFRATNGKVGGRMGKAKILLLHHDGRRSGKHRVSPLIYVDDAPDKVVVIASKGGVDKHPAWFHNVTAMDTTEVELPGGEKRRVRPRVATGEERERLWQKAVAAYKPYTAYASYTDRQIPVVVLEPAA